jgi:hypothetical protein
VATLLTFGHPVNGDRDCYTVEEELEVVVQALNGDDRFVCFTDPGDNAPVWFRVDAVRYAYTL